MFHMIHPARLLQGLVARYKVATVEMQRHFRWPCSGSKVSRAGLHKGAVGTEIALSR